MRSGEEIQAALRGFVASWRDYSGTERAEAQTFLNELLACYGVDRREVGAQFEHHPTGAGFMDLHLPAHYIVEMKAPSKADQLGTHYPQLEAYWRASASFAEGRQAARFVLLCAFHRFEVYEPGRFPGSAIAEFSLEELPDRYDALAFLAGPGVEPSFVEHHRQLTKEAAGKVAQLFESLVDRSAAPVDEIQRFAMQSVWTMFAEDLGMLEGYPMQSTVAALHRDSSRSAAAEIGLLFRVLNQKGSHNRQGLLAGTRYVNGELFAQPAEINLSGPEVELLSQACQYDWRQVDPTIFGSLLEGVLGRSRRWALGAHYTHEVDIMKIVAPTIVRPWRERIAGCGSAAEARLLLDELCSFRVLDPACGCGNFLYIAYRELRGLESELKSKIRSLAADAGVAAPPGPWPYYSLSNLQGIDIENVAVLIARVTLWMGHRQMIEKYGGAEDPLPLVDLSAIRRGDALRDTWPETDCIVGNPPFLGDRRIRGRFGDEYVAWLKREFAVGVVDYSAYWFRRSVDHLKPGQRAGLVSTNTLRENKHRVASLDYVVGQGGVITEAVSSQKWPGDAKVHVSITNWVDSPASAPGTFLLDGLPVEGISTQLRPARLADPAGPEPATLPANAGLAFIGCYARHQGFVISDEEAASLRSDSAYAAVVRQWLTGEDVVQSPSQEPRRWIIDFAELSLEQAASWPLALTIVRERVKPDRVSDPGQARRWWKLWNARPAMRAALTGLPRYVGAPAVGKRFLTSWQDMETCPAHKIIVFSFDDDYSMGVLTSAAHGAWAWAWSSTLETRLNYTPSTVFTTFPWPDPVTAQQHERVAELCRRLFARRGEICVQEQIGLTKLYNAMDEGAWTDLKDLHRQLDEAVAACYGWPASVAQDDVEIVRRLTALNAAIAQGVRSYEPFRAR